MSSYTRHLQAKRRLQGQDRWAGTHFVLEGQPSGAGPAARTQAPEEKAQRKAWACAHGLPQPSCQKRAAPHPALYRPALWQGDMESDALPGGTEPVQKRQGSVNERAERELCQAAQRERE